MLAEAERLVAAGVRELLVISQDTSAYGADIRYRESTWRGRRLRASIDELAAALGELGAWVRLHYVYPYPHVDALIPLMAEGRVLPYLDVPFQHASPRVLKRMRRSAATENTLERLRQWRSVCPEITVRSTFIVGFPGETERDFERLLEFLHEAKIDRAGCFRYSPVEGAAANALDSHVPDEVKDERFERFMQAQAGISASLLARRVGSRMTVLVDEIDGDTAIARGPGDAPEIDGNVMVRGAGNARRGEFLEVVVEDAGQHDLFAVPAPGGRGPGAGSGGAARHGR